MTRRFPARTLWILVLASFSGCQSLTLQDTSPPMPGETVTVEVRRANRKPVQKSVLLKPDMRLQDVVNQTKSNFRNKDVYIVRVSPTTGQKHKLAAEFGTNRRISLETDYAVQPGDRVVIAQDTTTSFEKVMLNVLGRS